MRVLFLVLSVAADCVLATGTIQPGDLPEHYFSGRVCRGKGLPVAHTAGYPCEKPIRSVTVTIRNSIGQVVTAQTDEHGGYVLDPIPLLGTEEDSVTFEAPKLVALQVVGLTFEPNRSLPNQRGATILLPKQRAEKGPPLRCR